MSNLRSTRITNTTITAKWNPAISPSGCGPVFYYNVTILNATYATAIETSETIATFSNLEGGVQYNISVVAVNRAGTGPSHQIIVTTGKSYSLLMNNVNICMCVYILSYAKTPSV